MDTSIRNFTVSDLEALIGPEPMFHLDQIEYDINFNQFNIYLGSPYEGTNNSAAPYIEIFSWADGGAGMVTSLVYFLSLKKWTKTVTEGYQYMKSLQQRDSLEQVLYSRHDGQDRHDVFTANLPKWYLELTHVKHT